MKNVIFLDIDTERAQVVQIGKPAEIKKPSTAEEAKEMINLDISCLSEALCTLIHMADQNAYGNKKELVEASIKHLSNMLIEVPKKD